MRGRQSEVDPPYLSNQVVIFPIIVRLSSRVSRVGSKASARCCMKFQEEATSSALCLVSALQISGVQFLQYVEHQLCIHSTARFRRPRQTEARGKPCFD